MRRPDHALARRMAAAGAVAMLLAACGGSPAADEPGPEPTAPDWMTSPTTEPTDDGPTETAGAMTLDQAQQIVDATTEHYNRAVIRMLTEQRIGQSVLADWRNIYDDPMFDIVNATWTNAAMQRFDGYNTTDPTGVVDQVLEIVNEQDDCFVVRVERRFDGLAEDPDSSDGDLTVDTYFLAFQQVEEGAERDGAGTGWIRTWDANFHDERPTDLCTRTNPGLGDSDQDTREDG